MIYPDKSFIFVSISLFFFSMATLITFFVTVFSSVFCIFSFKGVSLCLFLIFVLLWSLFLSLLSVFCCIFIFFLSLLQESDFLLRY